MVSVIRYAVVEYLTHNIKQYEFKTDIEDLQEGDVVVVDSALGLGLASFIEYREAPKYKGDGWKWIIQRVDLTAHKARIAAEQRMQELQKAIEKRAAELKKEREYRQLAEGDEHLTVLLDELDAIRKGAQVIEIGGGAVTMLEGPVRAKLPGRDAAEPLYNVPITDYPDNED